jgi:erythromycin esterase-like protein
MWANRETVELIEWMRERSLGGAPLAFYGLDVYSLWESLSEVADWLRKHDPSTLPAAAATFACFDAAGDVQAYATRARLLDASCEPAVVRLLSEVRRSRVVVTDRFDVEQNALIVQNAERYYRIMLGGGPDSWNLRDLHMADTLDRILAEHGSQTRAVVWAHNTHVGDARHTEMANVGMLNLGQLARERHGPDDVVIVGFGSHQGTVIASRGWEEPMQRMRVPEAQRRSWEAVMHDAIGMDSLLVLSGIDGLSRIDDPEVLAPRGHRAIGVVYRPEHEAGNYVPTVLPRRYDAFVYLDRTTALHPLHRVGVEAPEPEAPETFPSGM